MTGSLSAQGIQLDESEDLSLRDGMTSVNVHNGSGGFRASACDDFNRANGGVGAGWTDVSGTQMVLSNQVTNSGTLGNAWMRKVGTTEPYSTSKVELDLVANPSGSSRYSAAVLGEDGFGVNMLYVKVQNQTGLAGYSNYAFYVGFNGGGRPGYGGFFSFGFQLDAANDGCHMLVETVADVTWLRLDDDLNGAYEHNFNSVGTVSSMGLAFGNNVGYGAWSAGTADNWGLNGDCGGCTAPTLVFTGTTVGGTATATIDSATANGAVVLGYSLVGGGPVNVNAGACGTVTVNVTPPVTQVNLTANAGGTATFNIGIPVGTTGVNVWIQAFDVGSCTLTNGIHVTLDIPPNLNTVGSLGTSIQAHAYGFNSFTVPLLVQADTASTTGDPQGLQEIIDAVNALIAEAQEIIDEYNALVCEDKEDLDKDPGLQAKLQEAENKINELSAKELAMRAALAVYIATPNSMTLAAVTASATDYEQTAKDLQTILNSTANLIDQILQATTRLAVAVIDTATAIITIPLKLFRWLGNLIP